jgi:hypothetical protein
MRGGGGLGTRCGLGVGFVIALPINERYTNKPALLPPTVGPACTWSHVSWTRPSNEQVTKEMTASDGCCQEWAREFTVACEMDVHDLCAPWSALNARVASHPLEEKWHLGMPTCE